MIPQNDSTVQRLNLLDSTQGPNPKSWQQQLANGISEPKELLQLLDLPLDLLDGARAAEQAFAMRIPRVFVDRMEKGNINDPLLRQVLPLAEEMQTPPAGFILDPLAEQHSNPIPGIVHKYHSRVLLITTGSCAVNCRYCFRRHFPYGDNNLSRQQWQQSLDYVRERKEINEVILSGGDPLNSSNQRLFDLITEIEHIEHVTRLRIHTRLPVVLPARICDELLARLSNSPLAIIMVIHANHANELDNDVQNTLHKLQRAGIHMLNQSVLLKGVNDSVEALVNLSEALFSARVLPYYLHLLDPVVGAHHFDVPQSRAQNLLLAIQGKLPGFLVPKLVREVAERDAKTPIPTPISPILE